ncbi:MAG: helix-turn-helix transcriptional regulator [Clostridiales bacterium]|nr:helix-turn-helix transcriptional regulator [Clostridiales bacterium]
MSEFQEFLNKQLQDDDFRKEYEAIQPEMDIIKAIMEARAALNLTEKVLSERTGLSQDIISRLECGTCDPTLSQLKQLADGMDMDLRLVFTLKNK